ncbi:MAG: hypothetical protein K1X71_18830 [Pirellulales bacterium]|jgi:apolipoprotein N-acyltransferase|nr:hypothetical protein [Pirellulales bacterium]
MGRVVWFGVAVGSGLAAGLLLSLAFPPYRFGFLAWFCLIPAALCLRPLKSSLPVALALVSGSIAFHLAALGFIRQASTTGHFGPYTVLWIATALTAAAAWSAGFCLARFALPTSWPLAILFPLVYLFAELTRRAVFVFVDGMGFPFLELGFTQIDSPIAQMAALGGVPLISFLLAGCNGVAADLALGGKHSKSLAIATGLAIGATWMYGEQCLRHDGMADGPRVAVGLWGLDEDLSERLPPCDLLVFAETCFPGAIVEYDHGLSARRRKQGIREASSMLPVQFAPELDNETLEPRHIARRFSAALVIGCRRAFITNTRTRVYNSALYVDETGRRGCYDKIALAAGGDFVPYFAGLLHVIPIDQAFANVPRLEDPSFANPIGFDRGSDYPAFTLGVHRFAATICYDSCFPFIYRRLMRNRPDFFVQCGNETIDSRGVGRSTLLTMSRFRAIECRRAIARSVSGGYSAIIDGNGRLRDVVSTARPVVAAIPLDQRNTLYSFAGNWTAQFVATVVVARLFYRFVVRRFSRWFRFDSFSSGVHWLPAVWRNIAANKQTQVCSTTRSLF